MADPKKHIGRVKSYDSANKRGLVEGENGRSFYFKTDDIVGVDDADMPDIKKGRRMYFAQDDEIQTRAQQIVLLDADDDDDDDED